MSSSTTTEPIGANGDAKAGLGTHRNFVDTSLISLKCLLFFFFGGIGCLLPFLPLHMVAVGLSTDEIRTISIISPLIAILGPLVAGPLADRVARRRLSSEKQQACNSVNSQNIGNGRYLRVMIAVCLVFSALFYSLLLVVPVVERIELPQELRPSVKFSCDDNGAIVHQERCRDAIGCHRWSDEDFVGQLHLQRCRAACYPLDEKRRRGKYPPAQADSPTFSAEATSSEPILEDEAAVDDESSGENLGVIPLETDRTTTTSTTTEVPIPRDPRAGENSRWSEQPRVCYLGTHGETVCHYFEEYGSGQNVNASLLQAINPDDTDDWCAYPVAQKFTCKVPRDFNTRVNHTCLVECQIEHPYAKESMLAESQCSKIIGNEQLTFWMYLGIRCLADVFPTAALVLVDAAIVIATRETSTGRGDVGRQLAFGSLGIALFGPLSGYLVTLIRETPVLGTMSIYAPILLHAVLMFVAACVALSANSMPLGPPEWWWHTRGPVGASKKYGGETLALVLVLVLLGGFWSVIDSYLPIHLNSLKADEMSIGVALTVGALPAVLFLFKSEHLVDYCGHSNLLITAFIMYILRFTGLCLVETVWWALIPGALELFTLEIVWVTAVLYFRHLMPRQMTATGQALPVVAHFCIGRTIGAVLGAYVDKFKKSENEIESMRNVYFYSAIAAATIATLYFLLYHAVLKPRCHAQTVQNGHRQPPSIVQAMNGNGNYTPLRVYQNGSGQKGEFRY